MAFSSGPIRLVCLLSLGAMLSACAKAPPPQPIAAGPVPVYADAAREWGLKFRHSQGTLLWYIPQITGPGAALLDFDGDGALDTFLVQGSGPDDGKSPARMPPAHLYRQGDGRFEECAAVAGVAARGFGMAVLATDLDNDGYPDLVLTCYGAPTRLWRNNGDGTFTERAAAAGIAGRDPVWPSFVTALDYDRDGLLDVYHGQYLEFRAKHWLASPPFLEKGGGLGPVTLLPSEYRPLPNTLYRNSGDGTFADRTSESGVADEQGQGMGALALDFDHDGWTDLMVGNDGRTRDRAFQNQRDGTFRDLGEEALPAARRGSMGFAVGDYDQDGTYDIVVTHFQTPLALYRAAVRPRAGLARVMFVDRAYQAAISDTVPLVGWAASFLDVENDGFEDLLEIDGHANPPKDDPTSGRMGDQVAHFYQNTGAGTFEARPAAGPQDPLSRARVGRGAGFGDLDRDGTLDVVLNNNNQSAELWIHTPAAGRWVGLWLTGTWSNRDALGAAVEIFHGPARRIKQVTSGESYFSTNATHLLAGLGEGPEVVSVRARWPGGRIEEFHDLAVRRYHRLVEGTGSPSLRGP